jgi:hypothetical protein
MSRAAITARDCKSAKKTDELTFALLGSSRAKDAQRTLMKSSPENGNGTLKLK